MIETTHIDFKSIFYHKVMALGRKHASTLGFMPEGGFEDHVRKQCLFVAHDGDLLSGYVMYREVLCTSPFCALPLFRTVCN